MCSPWKVETLGPVEWGRTTSGCLFSVDSSLLLRTRTTRREARWEARWEARVVVDTPVARAEMVEVRRAIILAGVGA
jgi:hypothetical protein